MTTTMVTSCGCTVEPYAQHVCDRRESRKKILQSHLRAARLQIAVQADADVSALLDALISDDGRADDIARQTDGRVTLDRRDELPPRVYVVFGRTRDDMMWRDAAIGYYREVETSDGRREWQCLGTTLDRQNMILQVTQYFDSEGELLHSEPVDWACYTDGPNHVCPRVIRVPRTAEREYRRIHRELTRAFAKTRGCRQDELDGLDAMQIDQLAEGLFQQQQSGRATLTVSSVSFQQREHEHITRVQLAGNIHKIAIYGRVSL